MEHPSKGMNMISNRKLINCNHVGNMVVDNHNHITIPGRVGSSPYIADYNSIYTLNGVTDLPSMLQHTALHISSS